MKKALCLVLALLMVTSLFLFGCTKEEEYETFTKSGINNCICPEIKLQLVLLIIIGLVMF